MKNLLLLAFAMMVTGLPPTEAAADPQIKVYAFLVKLPGLTDAQFSAHWRDPHGTLTKRIPQFRRYVQNHGVGPVPTVPGLAPTPYLGIPNVWVDSAADLAATAKDPVWPELDADSDKLYVRAQIAWVFTTETIVKPLPRGAATVPAKAMLLLKAGGKPLDAATMKRLADRAIAALPTLVGVSTALSNEPGALFDGFLELYFTDQKAFAKAWGKGEFLAQLADSVDLAASRGFLANEERVIWTDTP